MPILSIDIETYSDVDLAKCGVYAYSDSPNFEILLFAYALMRSRLRLQTLPVGRIFHRGCWQPWKIQRLQKQHSMLSLSVPVFPGILAGSSPRKDGSVRPFSLRCWPFPFPWITWVKS